MCFSPPECRVERGGRRMKVRDAAADDAAVLSSSNLLLSSLELSDAQVYEPQIRARLGTASHFCEVVVLKLRTVPIECRVERGGRRMKVRDAAADDAAVLSVSEVWLLRPKP